MLREEGSEMAKEIEMCVIETGTETGGADVTMRKIVTIIVIGIRVTAGARRKKNSIGTEKRSIDVFQETKVR